MVKVCHFFKGLFRKEESYLYEKEDNVLRLERKISFGIEIEFQLESKSMINSIAQRLVEGGYTTTEELRKYDAKGNGKEWVLKKEETCDYELSSPVFYDSKDAWEQIDKICCILKKCDAYTDDNCALHIHIGVDGILRNGEEWVRLFKTYRKCEPFIIRFSGDLSNSISHTRLEKYALCINTAINNVWLKGWTLEECLDDIADNNNISLCSHLFAVRQMGMNWRCLNEEERTIEFRTFNGSLNPITIQEYIFVVSRLVDCVNESRSLNVDEEYVIFHRKMKNEYIDAVIKYLFPEKDLQMRFGRVFRKKPILDEYTWNMLEGTETIDRKAVLQ